MPCTRYGNIIICTSPFYRLRLADGRCVYMEWHSYLGPTIYRDKACNRMLEDWYDDPLICDAVGWFAQRGCKG